MPFIEKGLVVSHLELTIDMRLIKFIAPKIAEECKPGQFLHVKPCNSNDPLLRRPLSIYDVDQKNGLISLLYKIVGKGTNLLSNIKVDDDIDIMGPLGRGFSLPAYPEKILLIGGGVGIAPLLYLGRVLTEQQSRAELIYGVNTAGQLVAANEFEQLGIAVMSATIDGSAGHKGLVTDLLTNQVNPIEIDRVYTCGPEPMMASVAEYAATHHLWGEVSLEEHMACGVGACLGCARMLKTGDQGYVKVCKDGPVFNINEVELYKK